MNRIKLLFDNSTASHGCISRRIPRKRLVTAFVLTVTLTAQIVLTGAVNIRCEAVIIDCGEERRVLTAFSEPNDILSEQRVALHPLDKAELTETDGVKKLTVIRAAEVTLNVNGKKRVVRGVEGETVGELLNRQGIQPSEFDYVKPSIDDIVYEGAEIVYEKAFPITIEIDGEVITTEVAVATVEELLAREGIILGQYDRVSHELSEEVAPKMEIKIDRVEHIETSVSEPVPFETEYRESSLYAIGTEVEAFAGEVGERITTTTRVIVNGVPEENYVSETVTIPPKNRVILVGTALAEPYSKKEGDFRLVDGIPEKYEYSISGKVTAYTAPEGAGTYSGRKLEIGTIGVDPDVIPFGSEVYICSKDGSMVYGYAIAADTGDLSEVIADVFMGTTAEHYADACRWGAQEAVVYVLSVGDNSISWK